MDVSLDLRTHLQRLEEDLLRPEIRSSRTELEARLAPDFLEIGRSGRVYDRAALILALASEGDAGSAVARVEDYSVRLLTPNVALATYRMAPPATVGASAGTLRSSIWLREGDAWQMVFHQATPGG